MTDRLISELRSALFKPLFVYTMAKAKVAPASSTYPPTPRQRGAAKALAGAEDEIREAVRVFVEAGGLRR